MLSIPSPFSPGIVLAGKVQTVPVLKTSTGGSSNVKVPVPAGAVALIGVDVYPGTTRTTHGIIVGTYRAGGVSQDHLFLTLPYFSGTSSSAGCLPLNFDGNDIITVQTLEGTSTDTLGGANMMFLISPVWVPLPSIPFRQNPSEDEGALVSLNGTSATNSAQTLTATTVTSTTVSSNDAIELVSGWFYTSGGTATGTLSVYDGTTKVTIDSTAAVASYVFNCGAKGSRFRVPTINGTSTNTRFTLDVGTAGVGNTSSAFLIYRALGNR